MADDSNNNSKDEGKERAVIKQLADAVQEHLHGNVDEDAVRRIAGEEIAKRTMPQVFDVRLPDGAVQKVEGAHRQFAELLGLVEEGHNNLMLVGPAGSGKTTLAKTLAHALNLPFGFISLSAGVTETHLLGRVLPQADGSWQYQKSLFVKLYEEGGVFLLDEIDAADANVMVAINAALANGVLANPISGTLHPRHKDTLILAAANTWGRGADTQYAGRNALDASTLDRFVLSTLDVQYDVDLERALASGALPSDTATALLEWVTSLRAGIRESRLRRVASTRLLINAVAALKAGRTMADIKTRYFQDWSRDERAKLGV